MKKYILCLALFAVGTITAFSQVTLSIHDIEMERIMIKECLVPVTDNVSASVEQMSKYRLKRAIIKSKLIRVLAGDKKASEFLSSGHTTGIDVELSVGKKGKFLLKNTKLKEDKSGWILFFDEADALK